jgi:hypothetical protein
VRQRPLAVKPCGPDAAPPPDGARDKAMAMPSRRPACGIALSAVPAGSSGAACGWGRDGLGTGRGEGREGAEGVDVDYAPLAGTLVRVVAFG